MSRFAQLHGGPIRVWAPLKSLLRIEYAPALLREMRIASAGSDSFGALYGIRHGRTIRLVATRARPGLDAVGTFASRANGEVFLTEQDLERFEQAKGSVALVIAGQTGGFFVRDANGGVESVQSLEEFSIGGPFLPRPDPRSDRRWPWAAGVMLAVIPLILYRPRSPQLVLSVAETQGQMEISWNIPTKAILTIADGGERSSIPITPEHSSVTYMRRSGDVTVAIGAAQTRFVGMTEVEQVRASVRVLEERVAVLRAELAAGQIKLALLERRLQ